MIKDLYIYNSISETLFQFIYCHHITRFAIDIFVSFSFWVTYWRCSSLLYLEFIVNNAAFFFKQFAKILCKLFAYQSLLIISAPTCQLLQIFMNFQSWDVSKTLRVQYLYPKVDLVFFWNWKVLKKAFETNKLLLVKHGMFVANIYAESLNDTVLDLFGLPIEHFLVFIESLECDPGLCLSISFLN